jgi:hypothetical protein
MRPSPSIDYSCATTTGTIFSVALEPKGVNLFKEKLQFDVVPSSWQACRGSLNTNRIVKAVDEKQLLDLSREFIRTPSVSGEETELAELVAKQKSPHLRSSSFFSASRQVA